MSNVVTRAGPARGRFTVSAFEMERVVSLNDAAMLSGLSRDTLRRNYPDLIRKLSPRRVGVRLKDVLAIGANNNSAVVDTAASNSTA
jgi:hypothetical protein